MITTKDLQQQIDQHFQELVDETDKARSSEAMLDYLNFCARFHQYSPNNIWLILLARPDASHVAGYRKWQSMGRWVRKGEQGIPIFAPLIHKEIDENDREHSSLFGFKIVHIFDIQQTEGQPLPPQPDWKSPEKHQELNQLLIEYAKSQSISVAFKDLSGEVQGISRGDAIEVDQQAGSKTLVHEITHELLHQKQRDLQSSALKELEAESVAYIVCRHFGITGLNSPNYIAFNGISRDQMVAHLARIQNTASAIISSLEDQGSKESRDLATPA